MMSDEERQVVDLLRDGRPGGPYEVVVNLVDRYEAQQERLKDLRARWRALPVWGPNPQGLHILDDVDVEGLLADFDSAMEGTEPRRNTRGRARS